MDDRDDLQRTLMSKLVELESRNKRRLPPDEIHFRLHRNMDKGQKNSPVISKELFCKAIRLLKEQETIDDEFGRALQKVGNGHFVYGTENKYREALLMVLKDTVKDQYDYIDWWLYEGAPDYKIWNEDESKEWNLTEPEALYEFITGDSDKVLPVQSSRDLQGAVQNRMEKRDTKGKVFILNTEVENAD